jgi:hypothetical protein
MADKNLKNTILVENEEFNINAVTSDTAHKVENPLIVKKSGKDAFRFDGSIKDQTIDFVPTSGGSYSGYVHITNTADITNDPTYDTAILTSSQITNRIVNLHGSPICVWNADDNYQLHSLKDDTDKLYKLTTIVGTAASFEVFKSYLGTLSKGLAFTLNSDQKTCRVSGVGSCTDLVVHIPEYSDDGIPVTSIGGGAFKNSNITEVVLPSSITSIGASAFYGCTTLEKIIMSDSVNTIGDSAFYGCTGLTDAILGAGLKSIGTHAFHGCVNLGGISLPNGITEVSDGLFYECQSLVSLILPEGTTRIGYTSFCGCHNLINITLPKSVVTVDNMAFLDCTALESVSYSGTSEEWAQIEIIGDRNTWLTNATLVPGFEYAQSSVATGGVINISDVAKGPFIYICRDLDDEFNPPNRIYLKLPNDDTIVELSKGATSLSSNYNTTDYYTYEGLAEIIARINKRLEALGGEELKVNRTDIIPVPSLENLNALVPDKEIKEYFDPNAVPTVQELDKITKELRADLDDLTAEVAYELEQDPDNPIFAANSRIDDLEDAVKNLQTNGVGGAAVQFIFWESDD